MFKITKAPITPGIQPQSVSKKIIKKDPQPLSITESGGKIIANKTLKKLIISFWLKLYLRRVISNFVTDRIK
ncbi:MAG: hypothetical protein ACI9JT_002450 [Polaribacter sp.]